MALAVLDENFDVHMAVAVHECVHGSGKNLDRELELHSSRLGTKHDIRIFGSLTFRTNQFKNSSFSFVNRQFHTTVPTARAKHKNLRGHKKFRDVEISIQASATERNACLPSAAATLC